MNVKVEMKPWTDASLADFTPRQNGDGGDFGALLKHAEAAQSEGAAELEKYLKMTPAERMTAAMLNKLGISKEEFDGMSPEQQAAITARITEMIRQEMEQKMAQQAGATTATPASAV